MYFKNENTMVLHDDDDTHTYIYTKFINLSVKLVFY